LTALPKPKILQGSPNKSTGSPSSASTGGGGMPSVSQRSKDKSAGGSSGRSAKKEDPLALPGTYVPLEDGILAANGSGANKNGKEQSTTNKGFKTLFSKVG
jgi:hypothetical protein